MTREPPCAEPRADPSADPTVAPLGQPGGPRGAGIARGTACSSDDLIELLFFAYRDFVGDPDRILAQYGFGRAHHRVLHFVDRYPGLTIAELLDILRITKQSLNRVLKDLIEQGYIAQRTGTSDRRQRLLFCSETGAALAAELTRVQARRLARALAMPGAAGASPEAFLLAMIEPDERAAVRRLMARRGQGSEDGGDLGAEAGTGEGGPGDGLGRKVLGRDAA